MRPFRYNHKMIQFSAHTGTVAGEKESDRQEFVPVGGGGVIHNGTGYIAPPRIRTRTIHKHEFWLIGEDGIETPVNAGGQEIPLREGQKVTVIAGYPQGRQNGWNLLLYNYNARDSWFILSTEEMVDYYRLAGKLKSHLYIAMFLVFPGGVFTWALVLGRLLRMPDSGGFFVTAFLLAIASAILYGVLMSSLVKRQRERAAVSLMEHVAGLMDEILKKG